MKNLGDLNLDFKGSRYCELLTRIVKKVDILNVLKDEQIKHLCGELSFVNGALNKTYNIIFKRGLNMKEAISKISKITDRDRKPFISEKDATKLYNKFQEFNQQIQGGGANQQPYKEDVPPTGSQIDLPGTPQADANRQKKMGEKMATNTSSDPKKPIKSKLSFAERRVVDKTFDMMEVLLICLSLLPLTGWAFDFPLLIYSLAKKKYTLAMITVLNWYIWAFLIMFGVNVNMGPTLKASYLGNQENIIKKLLLFPQLEPSKVLNPFVKARPVQIDGEKFLIDENDNVYSSEIKSPATIGIMDVNNVFVPRDSPDYEDVLRKKKTELQKDKVGPTNLI